MYGNPYMNNFNPQNSLDRINNQIAELERMKTQLQQPVQPVQQPTNLTQNFQISPTNREVIKYANNIEEVQKDMIIGDTPYFSKDMSVVWIKNIRGDIKTYELNEIVPQDEKDIIIANLKDEVESLNKMIKEFNKHEQSNKSNDEESSRKSNERYDEPIKSTESTSISPIRTTKKK